MIYKIVYASVIDISKENLSYLCINYAEEQEKINEIRHKKLFKDLINILIENPSHLCINYFTSLVQISVYI